MRVNRFVLDPNIWISYFITKTEDTLLDIVIENKITIFICDELVAELKRVLAYPKLSRYKINVTDAVNFVKDISVYFDLSYPIKRYVSQDENDDYVVALALQTNSGFITSGDSHILSEKSTLERKFKKLRIISKAEFEDMFSD